MKILLTVTLALVINTVFGQAELPGYKTVLQKFENFYNNEKYDSIFSIFSKEMQTAMPLEKANRFFAGIHSQAGKIKNREFIKYKSTFAIYKTQFENTTMAVNISVDAASKINGLLINAFKEESLPKMERNITKMTLPFKEEWTVVWGGDTKELNYHVESNTQKNAFDLLITNNKGDSYKTNGETNEDYYAFGKELFAPCDGEVVLVIDAVIDNKVGEMNSVDVGGNTVVIKTTNNEFAVFCHFKNGSIVVKKGQQVQQGQMLGQCGNSGHSSEPHLHFHLQNGIDMNTSTGIKCYFDKLNVNGKLLLDYSPIQKDKIKL